MAVWGISDLHLSFGLPGQKEMGIFGARWKEHTLKLENHWRELVAPDDIVLVPGDLSWALKPRDVVADLQWLGALPGKKVLCKGNHDLWWNSYNKTTSLLPDGVYAVQNNAVILGDLVFFGTRGWDVSSPEEEDPVRWARIFKREVGRMRRAVEATRKIGGGRAPICLTHYPPLIEHDRPTEISALVEKSGTRLCVYGHLHGEAGWIRGFQGTRNHIQYVLLSCDYLDFRPKLLIS